MTIEFFLFQIVKLLTYFAVSCFGGWLVFHLDIRVNYTRKINHFVLFFLPVFYLEFLPYQETLATLLLGFAVGLFYLLLYMESLRRRVPILDLAFRSFDRPEDRPHTLLWLFSQVATTYVVIIGMIVYLHEIDRVNLIYIPIFINGIGDGLAEPIGVRFGRHKYRTRPLFGSGKYERSLEGSAVVFITATITILAFQTSFSGFQLISALILFPVLMTLAEAWSPHTWDSPFLFLIAWVLLHLVLQI